MAFSYVYIHTRLDGNVPFYVGKGCGKRITDRCQRNNHWRNIVKKDGGFNSQKIAENMDDELAFLVEIEAISKYKRLGCKLVNRTDGGEGHLGNHVNLGIPKSEAHKQNLRNVNLNKKQSIETIKKRKKTMKEKEQNGWIMPWKREENKQKGIKNHHFAGYFVTPKGTFDSASDAALINDIGVVAVVKRCKGNRMSVKGKTYHYPPKTGWGFIKKD